MATSSMILESPLGPLRLVAEEGAIVGLSMEGDAAVDPADPIDGRTPAGQTSLWRSARPTTPALRASARDARETSDQDPVLAVAAEQLAAWFAGTRRTFDLPLRPRGTPFQRAVWDELQRIPYGETRTYRDIAIALGRPSATRAVGAANGRNPVSIAIPCHRVIGASGALTGYAGGVARKRWLLEHERAVLARR